MSSIVVVRDDEPEDPRDPDAVARRRIRVVLSASALLVTAVMALPILTSFTHILDGVVGGIGAAYIVGFGEFVLAMAGAVAYCRWVDRLDGDGEGTR
ncbi:MAG TPA: hypothetical protein VHW04_16000 [Solirubrobacteraceae bacterium]|nr:hypothetical protein [Solirubrobacteraceae bacterium]